MSGKEFELMILKAENYDLMVGIQLAHAKIKEDQAKILENARKIAEMEKAEEGALREVPS